MFDDQRLSIFDPKTYGESREIALLKTNTDMEKQPDTWTNAGNNHGFTMMCIVFGMFNHDLLCFFVFFTDGVVDLLYGLSATSRAAPRSALAWLGSFPVGGPGSIARERILGQRWTLKDHPIF